MPSQVNRPRQKNGLKTRPNIRAAIITGWHEENKMKPNNPLSEIILYPSPQFAVVSPLFVSHLTRREKPLSNFPSQKKACFFIHGETYLFTTESYSRLIKAPPPPPLLSRLCRAQITSPLLLAAFHQDSYALLQTRGPTSSVFDQWVPIYFA